MVLGGDHEPDEGGLRAALDLVARGKVPRPDAGAHAWTAPERAALRTAEALGLAPTVTDALRDRDYGEWAGRSFEGLLAMEPGPFQEWLAAPQTAPPGGETAEAVITRVAGWLDGLWEMPAAPARRTVVAVAHPTVVCAAVLHVLGAQPDALRRLDIRPLTRVRLTNHPGSAWSLTL